MDHLTIMSWHLQDWVVKYRHMRQEKVKKWSEELLNGCYLGTLNEHYTAHMTYIKKMKPVENCETVLFKNKCITYQTVTLADSIIKAYHELARALKGMSNIIGQAILEALKQMEPVMTVMTNKSHKAHPI